MAPLNLLLRFGASSPTRQPPERRRDPRSGPSRPLCRHGRTRGWPAAPAPVLASWSPQNNHDLVAGVAHIHHVRERPVHSRLSYELQCLIALAARARAGGVAPVPLDLGIQLPGSWRRGRDAGLPPNRGAPDRRWSRSRRHPATPRAPPATPQMERPTSELPDRIGR